ncbi:MAG: hypothetical protein HQ483_11265 [Rhodospirillales bacterium]|nr:hypothetical protein [Rhodospirillales bacterium]
MPHNTAPRSLFHTLCRYLLAGLVTGLSHTATAAPGDENAITGHFGDHLSVVDKPAEALIAQGKMLFIARFTSADGAGRPAATQAAVPTKRRIDPSRAFFRTSGPDSNGCISCHMQPLPGGAGDFALNVFTTDGFVDADFDSMDPQFSNERGTTHLFGSGLVELLAREMTVDLHRLRDQAAQTARKTGKSVTIDLLTKGVSFGRLTVSAGGFLDISQVAGIDPDLVLRPFSQKGVFVSLREFSVNASNHHHGMQAVERFGSRWTGETDHDADGRTAELSEGDMTAMVAFQAALPAPTRTADLSPDWQAAADRGEQLFDQLDCSSCHRRSLPLNNLVFSEPGPFNGAGNLRASETTPVTIDLKKLPGFAALKRDEEGRYLVPLFSDLKRHTISDGDIGHYRNELLGQRFADRDQFLSGRLWGVGSTGPWGHRGDLTTLREAIQAHGGEGHAARNGFQALPPPDQKALIAFLQTLVIQ